MMRSTAMVLTIALFGAAAPALANEPLSSVRCESFFKSTSPALVAPKAARTLVELDREAVALVYSLEELALGSNMNLYYSAHRLIDTMIGSYTNAVEAYVVAASGSSEQASLPATIALIREGHGTANEKMEALDRVLKPGLWQRLRKKAANRDEEMKKLVDEIRNCRGKVQTCITKAEPILEETLRLFSEAKNFRDEVDGQITVLKQAAQTIQKKTSLSDEDKQSLSNVLNQKITQLATLTSVIDGVISTLNGQIQTAINSMTAADEQQRYALQALVMRGAPSELLQPKGFSKGPSPLMSLIDTALATGADNEALHTSIIMYLAGPDRHMQAEQWSVSAKLELSDRELVHLIDHLQNGPMLANSNVMYSIEWDMKEGGTIPPWQSTLHQIYIPGEVFILAKAMNSVKQNAMTKEEWAAADLQRKVAKLVASSALANAHKPAFTGYIQSKLLALTLAH